VKHFSNKESAHRFNPLNDYLFYKVMGEKGDEPQLTSFLNAVLSRSGRKPILSLEILEKKTFVKDLIQGKSCVLDVQAALSDKTKCQHRSPNRQRVQHRQAKPFLLEQALHRRL